jgi:hypothetical protein
MREAKLCPGQVKIGKPDCKAAIAFFEIEKAISYDVKVL